MPRTTAPWSMRSVTSNGRAKGVAFVGEEVTDDELKWISTAPACKGVRFNFIKRLVDFDAERRDAAHRRAHRTSSAGTSWSISSMPIWTRWEPFFKSLPTTLVFDHMGMPERARRASTTGKNFQNWLKAARRTRDLGHQGDLPGAYDRRRARPMTTWCRSARAIVERFPDRVHLGHRLAASQHAEGGARRRRAGRHHPQDRAHGGPAAGAPGRQPDAALLELALKPSPHWGEGRVRGAGLTVRTPSPQPSPPWGEGVRLSKPDRGAFFGRTPNGIAANSWNGSRLGTAYVAKLCCAIYVMSSGEIRRWPANSTITTTSPAPSSSTRTARARDSASTCSACR